MITMASSGGREVHSLKQRHTVTVYLPNGCYSVVSNYDKQQQVKTVRNIPPRTRSRILLYNLKNATVHFHLTTAPALNLHNPVHRWREIYNNDGESLEYCS